MVEKKCAQGVHKKRFSHPAEIYSGNKNEILRFNIDQQNVTHCHIQQISILKNKIITIITHKIGYKLY